MVIKDEKNQIIKKNFKKDEEITLKFEFFFELPFWVNLRSGMYKISHKNILKELVDKKKLQAITYNKDYEEYYITISNLFWKIGFDDFKEIENEKYRSISIEEDLKNNQIIDEKLLDEYFGKKKDEAHYTKLKTVIQKRYIFPITFKSNKSLSLKELIEPFIEPLKKDLLKAVNEFLEIYLGYFSTNAFNNSVYLLGDSAFSQDRVNLKIFLNEIEITEDVKFPFGFYQHPYYPIIFPKLEVEKRFFNLLEQKKYPSLAKVMKGISNNYFIHGDIKIGIVCLDISFESCISDFIEYYNSNQQDPSLKLKTLGKNNSLGDFIKNDLGNILTSLFQLDDERYLKEIKKFHMERNLIIHRKKRNVDPQIVDYRNTVSEVIEKLEDYIELPKVIFDPSSDFDRLIVGLSTERFERGWGEIKLFRSLSELFKYRESMDNKDQQ